MSSSPYPNRKTVRVAFALDYCDQEASGLRCYHRMDLEFPDPGPDGPSAGELLRKTGASSSSGQMTFG